MKEVHSMCWAWRSGSADHRKIRFQAGIKGTMVQRRSFLKTGSAFLLGLGWWPPARASVFRQKITELVLAENGRIQVPVVIAGDAGETTYQAAVDLTKYLARICGDAPEIIQAPQKVPESAIWIGIQPHLSRIYPGLNTKFHHPEEILIACNGKHLVIAGRDRFFQDIQVEFGTANAVYDFLQKHLHVRWLWPGELGEDIVSRENIRIPSLEYRFHPLFLGRQKLFRKGERLEVTDQWMRFQRIKLDSLKGPTGDHAFTDWWDRFHEDLPEWFALQPDGTRSGYPDPRTVKMCLSNPGLADQWLTDAEQDMMHDPTLNMLIAKENDAHSSGICVCENCRAWDHPQGHPWTFLYENGLRVEYVATTDRDITFWNRIAAMVKDRFPGRDNLYVRAGAYGPTTPVPVEAVPADNVILGYTGKFPTTDEHTRNRQKEEFKAWSEKAPNLLFRPNLWYWSGGVWGLPDVALTNVMQDMRFLGEHHCKGIFVDTAFEHWCTQGPQYYLITQLAWDPLADGPAILMDYYRRGFGRAAEQMEMYWGLMEEGFRKVVASEGYGPHGSYRYRLLEIFLEVYTEDFFEQAEGYLQQAGELVSGQPEKYRSRVGFVRTGLELARLMVENITLMNRVRESDGTDRKAVKEVSRNWKTIEELCTRAGPVAINHEGLLDKMVGTGYQGQMQDYFGPPREAFLKGKAKERNMEEERTDID